MLHMPRMSQSPAAPLLGLPTPDRLRLEVASSRGVRGAPLPDPTFEVVRELGPDDQVAHVQPRAAGTAKQPLKRVRAVHHKAAQYLALGMSQVRVAALTGMSPNTISVLQDDPAFQELLAHYMNISEIEHQDLVGQLATLGEVAVQEIQQRILDDPESFTLNDLKEMATMAMDRTGLPATKNVNKSVVSATVDVKEIRARAAAESVTKVVARDLGPVESGDSDGI